MAGSMPTTTSGGNHIRVLMVEDDRLLRTLAIETLLDDGIAAIGVEQASEALVYLVSLPDIELLVTDINMPGMNGLDLAALVRQRFPHVRILAVSGREQLNDQTALQPLEFLQKPFSASNFLTRIRGLLIGE